MKYLIAYHLKSVVLTCCLSIVLCFNSQAQSKGFTYTITLAANDGSCWEKSESEGDTLRIINSLGCRFTLNFGNDQIQITKNGKTDFLYTLTPDNKRMQLADGKSLNIPTVIRFSHIEGEGTCSINDDTPIQECKDETKPGKVTTNPKTNTPFLFIPTQEEEADFSRLVANGASAQTDNCCPGAQELVFDYQAQCFVPDCDLEDCRCNKCKDKDVKNACDTCKIKEFTCRHKKNSLRNFHPRVDGAIRVRIKGMNPYRDWVNMPVEFIDRNKEHRAEFKAMLSGKGNQDTVPPDKTKSTINKPQNREQYLKHIKEIIPAFRDEMAQFYQEKSNASNLNVDFLAKCIAHIQANIQLHFAIPMATPENMMEKLNIWLDNAEIQDIAEKEKYRAMLKDGIATYKKILNYNATSAFLFQVKNSDITRIGFEWYRHGARVSDKPQTFEFFNKGGFTIDYSAGIAINGLVDHEFTTLGIKDTMNPDQLVYEVVRKRGSTIGIGPVLLAHAYYRYPVWNRFKFGATTGFLTNANDDELGLNFMFGGSVLFGSEERFNLTGGWVIGKVARLAEGLKEREDDMDYTGSLYKAPDINESFEVPTRLVYRTRWFIGVTYNLGI